MKKTYRNTAVWVPLAIALAFAGGMMLSRYIFSGASPSPAREKLSTVLGLIGSEYVDEVDTDSLIEAMFPQLLSELDPHSSYIAAADLQSVNEELQGSFTGVGISFTISNDSITVLEVISGGPSEKVGLMAGDRIVTVNDSVVAGKSITNEKVMSVLRGPAGTKVKLGIKRSTSPKLLSYEVTRGPIPVTSIDASYMIDPRTGYIKVNKFASGTYDEFLTSMVGLKQAGASRYILDLRGNGGGFMEMAILMANEFLPSGSMIVATKGRRPSNDSMTFSDGTGTFTDAQLVVLIDEYSASASEILAGAVQDNDRGLTIGRRSFGKGLIQRQIELPDSSALRLTIARYYTPSGRCIQKNYTMGGLKDYAGELLSRYESGELFSRDSVKLDKNLIFKTVGGRNVYGGGGIVPDIFVANDTSSVTSYYLNVLNAGLMQKYAFSYADLNRQQLSGVKTVSQLLATLPPDDVLLQSFADYAASEGIPARWYYINISRPLLVNQLKALIARDILGVSAFYEITNRRDPVVSEALRQLDSGAASIPVTAHQ